MVYEIIVFHTTAENRLFSFADAHLLYHHFISKFFPEKIMKFSATLLIVQLLQCCLHITCFISILQNKINIRSNVLMAVKNDPFAKANREMRRASADDRCE